MFDISILSIMIPKTDSWGTETEVSNLALDICPLSFSPFNTAFFSCCSLCTQHPLLLPSLSSTCWDCLCHTLLSLRHSLLYLPPAFSHCSLSTQHPQLLLALLWDFFTSTIRCHLARQVLSSSSFTRLQVIKMTFSPLRNGSWWVGGYVNAAIYSVLDPSAFVSGAKNSAAGTILSDCLI